jgi:Cellulose biosynthesis protein BcsS
MRSRRRLSATAIVVAMFVFCLSAVTGRARDGDDEDARIMLFSGRDLWRHGGFVHRGIVFAPSGFDHDGLLLKLLFSGGIYRYRASDLGDRHVFGVGVMSQVLPGWRIKRGNAEFKLFFGPEAQKHYLFPDDPSNRLRGSSIGLRIAAELWYEPTPETMLAADVSLSSIATENSARAAYGWRILNEMLGGIYVGPETQYFGSHGYRNLRVGAHITSMRAEDTEWSAATGWAWDSQARASPYVRINVLKRL